MWLDYREIESPAFQMRIKYYYPNVERQIAKF